MQILVAGAGAVGGYFGGRLTQANRDVTFLVRAKRAEEIKANGLQIVSPHGNVTNSGNILQDMWEKWVQIAAVGIITCLSVATSGRSSPFPAAPTCPARDFANVLKLRACGHRPSEEFLER
jgi:ketopantoate reductase